MNTLYLRNELKRLANDESGVGVIEVVGGSYRTCGSLQNTDKQSIDKNIRHHIYNV